MMDYFYNRKNLSSLSQLQYRPIGVHLPYFDGLRLMTMTLHKHIKEKATFASGETKSTEAWECFDFKTLLTLKKLSDSMSFLCIASYQFRIYYKLLSIFNMSRFACLLACLLAGSFEDVVCI